MPQNLREKKECKKIEFLFFKGRLLADKGNKIMKVLM